MIINELLPRILIIDDLLGRNIKNRVNEERKNLCGQFLLKDVTGDESSMMSTLLIKKPVAEVVFSRGQKPVSASTGDVVENDLEGAMQTIREGWENPPPGKPPWTLVLLDLCFFTGKVKSDSKLIGMPEGRPGDENPRNYFGIKILEAVKREFPDLPVVILSSKPRDEISREFSYKGALGFLPSAKEDSPERLKEYIWKYGLLPDPTGEIVGYSKPLLFALRMARIKALTQQNLLIKGERGTGKGLLAGYINRQRAKHTPFVVANSSVLNPELFATELFGYLKGAFTGADRNKVGLIEKVHGGDLFFDEIGDMRPQVQAGILNVLQDRIFIPVGGTEPKTVNVRFLSATNKDIDFLVETDQFRRDLYDRLREGGIISIPPLRERKEDILLLADKFFNSAIEKWNETESKRRRVPIDEIGKYIHLKHIHPDTYEELKNYDWPGNIRELSNCVYNAVHQHIDVEFLSPHHLHIQEPLSIGGTTVSFLKGKPSSSQEEKVAPSEKGEVSWEEVSKTISSIDGVLSVLDSLSFENVQAGQLSGKLPLLNESYAKLLARYLKKALQKTSRTTPENPDGEIQITPAMKLISGESSLSTSKAADMVKRLLSFSPGLEDFISNDPVLKKAYDDAYRLRPRGGRKKSE